MNNLEPLLNLSSDEFLEQVERELCSKSLTDYKHSIWRRYQHAAHLQAIDDVLSSVARYIESGARAGIGRAIIEMPPRHGKTLTVSRLFPTWLLGRNPDLRVILVSYGADLAEKNSRAARNIIASQRFRSLFPDVSLALDSKSASAWDIAGHDGGLDAMGIGGGVTGKGAHALVIDDIIKNREQAESLTWRNKVWDSYRDDLYTRLEPGGAVVVMMTRWHEDDLIGRLLASENEKWHRLRMPAISTDGEPLWSERYPLSVLRDIEATLGSYSFAALYQQSPLPAGGGLFDATKIEIVDYVPECKQVVRFYDLAVTAKKTSDYTVGLKLGITADERPVILDVWRGQRELPDVQEAIVQNAQMDGASVSLRLEAEKAGIVQLQFLLRDPRMRSFVIDAKAPEGDKYTRAAPVAARVNAGRVLMVRAAWNRALLDELAVFPQGEHDDQVDALSGAYGMIADYPMIAPQRVRVRW